MGILLSGCLGAEYEALRHQVDAQQVEIERQQHELEALRQQPARYATPPAKADACDQQVMKLATRRGGARFAAGDFDAALGYYKDAALACPASSEAELNLGRVYEALNQSDQAARHYDRVLAAGDGGQSAMEQARDALARLRSGK